MKTILSIFFSLLLCSSCTVSPGGDAEGSSPISISAGYDARPYEYGEAITVELAINELGAVADYCLLTAKCSGGTATIVADGETLAWNKQQTVYYDVLNEKAASRKMHCVITPDASAEVEPVLAIEFQVSNAALDAVALKRLDIRIDNRHPVTVDAKYDNTPFEIGMTLKIELSAHKDGYTGDFEAVATLTSGAGHLLLYGKQLEVGTPFALPAGSECLLEYQPTAKGMQQIVFTVTDGKSESSATVRAEVYNQGGLVEPTNGIYIYAGGVYYSRIRWQDNKPAAKAEGVAVIADGCRFLIALSDVWGSLTGGWSDDLRKVTGLPNYTEETQARGDFDGLQNTRKILAALEAGILTGSIAARQCYYYDAANPGLWYLPAAGQLALIVDNYSEVTQCLHLINSIYADFKATHYFSSTGKGTYAWSLYGGMIKNYGPNYGTNCRPVRNL